MSGREPRSPGGRAPAVCLVSLGCAKNTVDSERILAALVQDGFLIAERPEDADLCLVNTCGFIGDAREETASVLRELAAGRRRGRPRRIIALGCLVERAAGVPAHGAFLAEADARIGFGDYLRLPAICRSLLDGPAGAPAAAAAPGDALEPAFHRLPRLVTGAGHSVSLKVSEGCSNGCRFCTIPRIRGRQVSRPVEEIAAEARDLLAAGAREICLIGQDTTSYGLDLYGRRCLDRLLAALSAVPGRAWFRLMYAYPRFLDDGVLDALAADPRFCRYLDLPLQHIADRMLERMGRGMTSAETRALLDRVRGRLPGVVLRSAFIVGHPGETDADFDELLAFVREGRFLYSGVFVYSPEDGTPSARQDGAVAPETARARRDALMEAQLGATRATLRGWIGREVETLAEEPVERGARVPPGVRWVGRIRGQAPEVDGVTLLAPRRGRRIGAGDFVTARVTDSLDYDLVAEYD